MLSTCDQVHHICRCLYKDKQEADQLKEAKLLEEEKAQFSVSFATLVPFSVNDGHFYSLLLVVLLCFDYRNL